MANFPSFTFTAAGRAAITRSLSGKDVDRLIITKCVLGDGVYRDGIETLKAVTSPKMTVTVSEYTDNGDGTSVTRFVYDNASLDVGFAHRETGIYAKNGDSGTELLLCYSNADNQYSYIKAGTVDSITKERKATIPPQTFKFVLATGGSGSVNAVIDPKGYVDVEMLGEHNTDPTAHPDKLVNLTTNGNSLRAVKGNGANVDVVVPYAVGTTQVNPKNLGSYATNKISDIRDLFNNELADMNTKGCSVRFIKFGADLSTISNNWAKNWDATMSPWGPIYGVMSLLGDNNYANVELVGFTGTTVLLQRSAGSWKPAETKVYTNGMLNVADTLKLQNGGLTFDANGTSVNQISVGDNPTNYTGNGYSYSFKDGKGNYADIYADEYYGTFRGKAMVGGITVTTDLNTNYPDTYSKKQEVTDAGTANNLSFKWNFITTYKNNTDVVQLAIPAASTARISLRCMPNQSNNTLAGNWLEIPYLSDIQPIAAAEVAKIVNNAPETLDTLNELANALGNDPNFATTVATQIGQKADRTELNNSLALHNADTTAHNNIINTVPRISILTGTCRDGETIPLPDGYTESQCKIFVSMSIENPDSYWYDVTEINAMNMLRVECRTDGRIIRCAMITSGFDSWRTGPNSGPYVGRRIACVANYMVIGIKYGG